jgi:hypothetical protein
MLLRLSSKRRTSDDILLTLQGNQHLGKLVAVLVRVLGGGTRLIEGDVGKRAAALLMQLQSSVPSDTLQAAASQLTAKQQAAFQTYMQGGVPTADE